MIFYSGKYININPLTIKICNRALPDSLLSKHRLKIGQYLEKGGFAYDYRINANLIYFAEMKIQITRTNDNHSASFIPIKLPGVKI